LNFGVGCADTVPSGFPLCRQNNKILPWEVNIMHRAKLRTGYAIYLVMIVMLPLLFGCGGKQNVREMALSPDSDLKSLQGNHVMLLAIKTDNTFKPEWPPEVYALEIINEQTKEKIQIAVQSTGASSLLKKGFSEAFEVREGSSSWEGLVSFSLPPGSYTLAAVRGGCTRSAVVAVAMASFDFPMNMPFTVNQDQFVYLGRIEMINRERLSDEIPSGDTTASRIPQYQSGFATGTFDVSVSDNLDQDITQFESKYPVLKNQKIAKQILPAWTKPGTSQN
jgi:hypothetical protein